MQPLRQARIKVGQIRRPATGIAVRHTQIVEIADEVGKGGPGFLQGLGIRLGDIDVAYDAVLRSSGTCAFKRSGLVWCSCQTRLYRSKSSRMVVMGG